MSTTDDADEAQCAGTSFLETEVKSSDVPASETSECANTIVGDYVCVCVCLMWNWRTFQYNYNNYTNSIITELEITGDKMESGKHVAGKVLHLPSKIHKTNFNFQMSHV